MNFLSLIFYISVFSFGDILCPEREKEVRH